MDAGVGGGFILIRSYKYEVMDSTACQTCNNAPPCSPMDGEWNLGGMGIQEPQSRVATRRPYRAWI
jgi:hypothetical protein